VVESCPQLRNLVVDGVTVNWETRTDLGFAISEKKPLPYLKVAQLGRIVSAVAIAKLMKCSPELRVMHAYCSPDMQDRELRHLVPHMKVKFRLYVNSSWLSNSKDYCYIVFKIIIFKI